MLMACEIDEKLLPRPPQLRGDQLGNKAGYEARRRVTSGVVRGVSRYKFGREAPKLIPTNTGLLPGKPRNRPSGRPSRGYGGPVWRPWPRARGPQRGLQDTLGAPRGPPKQCQRKTRRHLTQYAEEKKRTTNKHPKSNRYLCGFCAHALRGGLGETPRHKQNTKTCISLQNWTPGGATTQEHLVFYEGF
jgi:hypothetical protein